MNENIKNLWDAALEEFSKEHQFATIMLPEPLKEKFARLIIQECVGIVEDYGLSLVGSDENYLGETLNLSIRVQEAGNKIKEHFGVEE